MYPRRHNLCQPSKWAVDILKHFIAILLQQNLGNNSFCVFWWVFFFVENTKVLLLIFIQNRLFSKLLTLFSEVPFPRIQVPNSRPWDLSKTAQISIFSLCLYHTLHIWIYANNFLLRTHFWHSKNWYGKKNLLQYAETSFNLRVTICLHGTIFNNNKM